MKYTTKLLAGALALTFLLGACGDSTTDTTSSTGDTTSSTGSGITSSTTSASDGTPDQDRDRDRDRIHQVLESVVTACGDQDRDRLRDQVSNRVQQLIETQGLEVSDPTRFEIVDQTVTFSDAGAQVELRLRATSGTDAPYEVQTTLRLQRNDSGEWLLDDVPFCMASDETPTTLRDRDRDRETTSTTSG